MKYFFATLAFLFPASFVQAATIEKVSVSHAQVKNEWCVRYKQVSVDCDAVKLPKGLKSFRIKYGHELSVSYSLVWDSKQLAWRRPEGNDERSITTDELIFVRSLKSVTVPGVATQLVSQYMILAENADGFFQIRRSISSNFIRIGEYDFDPLADYDDLAENHQWNLTASPAIIVQVYTEGIPELVELFKEAAQSPKLVLQSLGNGGYLLFFPELKAEEAPKLMSTFKALPYVRAAIPYQGTMKMTGQELLVKVLQ